MGASKMQILSKDYFCDLLTIAHKRYQTSCNMPWLALDLGAAEWLPGGCGA